MANDQARQDMDAIRGRFDRLAGRADNGSAPRAVVAHQLFQTPPELAARLVAALGLNGGERVLEPSAGLGRILDAIPSGCEVVAVEMAADCARELYTQDRAGVRIMQRDFLTVLPDEIGYFDAVAMNPPFTMRSDIRHIRHALDFLRIGGGRLAALMMDTPHREFAFRDEAATWEKIPAGAFKSEGTAVPTILATFKV